MAAWSGPGRRAPGSCRSSSRASPEGRRQALGGARRMTSAPAPRLFTFAGGSSGAWRVEQLRTVVGDGLPEASHLSVVAGEPEGAPDAAWRLRGIVSNERYVERAEKDALVARQEGL